MTDYDQEWDKLLGIKTTGRDDSISDLTRYPYEPTDYRVLEMLAGTGYIDKSNTLLDYGCGKGRVNPPQTPPAGGACSLRSDFFKEWWQASCWLSINYVKSPP